MLYELDIEEENMENRVIYKHKPKDETFKITRDETGAYVVSGPGIERVFLMTNFNRDVSVRCWLFVKFGAWRKIGNKI